MELHWDSPVVQIGFALLLAILPLTITEIPVIYKCLLWAVSWTLLVHLSLTFFPAIAKLPVVVKSALIIGATSFLVAGTYKPILKMWIEEKASSLTGTLVAIRTMAGVPNGSYCMQMGTGRGPKICIQPHKALGFVDALGDNLTLKE